MRSTGYESECLVGRIPYAMAQGCSLTKSVQARCIFFSVVTTRCVIEKLCLDLKLASAGVCDLSIGSLIAKCDLMSCVDPVHTLKWK